MTVLQHLGLSLPFDSQYKLVTSPFFSPTVLAFLRLFLAIYSFVTLLFILIWYSVVLHAGSQYFSFFTQLTNIGICAYLWAAGTQSALYVLRQRKWYPLQRWPRFLQFLHLLLLSTIVTLPILVTIVYWALLASAQTFASPYSSWSSISLHAFNTVYALIEIFLTNAPPIPWLFLPLNILILGGYLGVAYITHATQGFYTYSFLDPSTHPKSLAGYIVGIALAEVIVFVIVHFLMVFRERIVIKKGRLPADSRIPSGERMFSPEGLEDWEDVNHPKSAAA